VEDHLMSARIIDRGRGPEIAGTRVTVYRIMDFLRAGSPSEQIARQLDLTSDQVQIALEYIDAHRGEVEAAYEAILGLARRSNPQWVEDRLSKSPEELRERLEARWKQDAAHADPVR
jgi:uncharacterized protein (DUF433 family)